MAPQASNNASSLLRYRPAIIAILAIAAGCTGYYLHTSLSASSTSSKSRGLNKGRLHRSNAVRRPRQPRPLDTQVPSTPQEDHFPISPTTIRSSFHYGDLCVTSSEGARIEVPLVNSNLPSAADIAVQNAISFTEAAQIRQDLEVAFLNAFIARGRSFPDTHFLTHPTKASQDVSGDGDTNFEISKSDADWACSSALQWSSTKLCEFAWTSQQYLPREFSGRIGPVLQWRVGTSPE